MELKDFIKAGNKVAFIPSDYGFPCWDYDVEPQIVTIGEYPVYFTDGTPDPKPEEYDGSCQVEIEEDIHGESQIKLWDLHPIEIFKEKEIRYAVMGSYTYKVIGKVLYDEEDYYILEDEEESWIIREESCFEFESNIYDLMEDELKRLRKQFCLGSIYLADYENSLGIAPNFLCGFSESYWDYLCEKYGEDNADDKDTPEEFAWFVKNAA